MKTPFKAPISIPHSSAATKRKTTAYDSSESQKNQRPDSTDRTNRYVDLPRRYNCSTAVICDSACMLPTESHLPSVIMAKTKDIKTTMLTWPTLLFSNDPVH